MRRTLAICMVMAIFAIMAAGSAFAYNPRVINSQSSRLNQFSFLKKKAFDEANQDQSRYTPEISLGSYASDGGSPGYIIGRSYKDDQNHGNVGRMVDWRTTPDIHFIYANQPTCGGQANPDVCARWIHYNRFDPSISPGGVFVSGANGIPLQTSPFTQGGVYANMDVDELGQMIGVGEGLTSAAGVDAVRHVKLWWDIGSATFVGDSIPDQVVGTGDVNFHYPVTAYQEFGGSYITHVVAINGVGVYNGNGLLEDSRIITHWRKVHTASGLGGTWVPRQAADGPWTDSYDIAVSRDGGGKVAISWIIDRADNAGGELWLETSDDAGATWNAAVEIAPFTEGVEGYQPWLECNLVYDSDNYLHAVYNVMVYDGSAAAGIDPARIVHWTDRVAGPDAGGKTSTVDHLDLDFGLIECAGSSNILNNGKVSVSECNGRLYVVWLSYGQDEYPLDCAIDSVSDGFRGSVNADIFMNISLGLDGDLWDFRRNLTNSHTPGCDGTDGNPCDHDAFPSVSRHGMNTAAMGTTFWGAVTEAFEVRDALDAGYPDDGYYLDVSFTNDIIADVARYMDTQQWSNNPIKWFRLPCVPPVIEPRIFIASSSFEHPNDYVQSGTEVVIDIDVENIGNDDLEVTNVSASLVVGAGWLTINTPTLNLLPASAGIVTVTLNTGGAINPAPGTAVAIEGYVIFESNDPNNPRDSLYVRTVVAADVIVPADEQIKTGLEVPLVVSNNGSAGGTGFGGNMQFYEADGIDLDCDSQSVYLYDLCPIVMYSADSGSFWWTPYAATSESAPTVDMVPVPGGVLAETGSTGAYNQHTTGQFVSADSTIGMIKTWAAPTTNVSYMIEKWQVYSFDGAPITALSLGEWVDMDVPSDSASDNVGTVVEADQYLYVSGWEANADQPCIQNDGRFYTTGLLGHYFQSAYDLDNNVNNTTMSGIYVQQIEDMMPETNGEFDPDSVWAFMNRGEFNANNSEWNDQRSFMSFGSFDIPVGDTLVIWAMHGTIINGIEADVATMNADAKVWYLANRDGIGTFGCCGTHTGGYPGNANFGADGKRNLADITVLIDHVYISKTDLLCMENGDVNFDDKNNLADITKLIDHVYISKAEFGLCQ